MIYIEDDGKYKDEDLLTDYGDGTPIENHLPTIDKVFHQEIYQTYFTILCSAPSSVILQ